MKHALVLSVMLIGLAQAQTGAATGPSVLVSFQPLYDVVSRVAGEQSRVERLVPIGASPHTFDPTVRDIARIRGANLVVMAGLGADAWLEKYVKASGSRAGMLKLGDSMTFTRLRSGSGSGQDAPTDPHWWLDASLMAQAARKTASELARLDPGRAATYRQNGEREARKLLALHSELQKTLAPIRGAKLVTFHNAFGYFARAYGLEVVATIAPTHDVEPSVQSMVQAVRIIRSSGVKAVFGEPQLPPGPARTVAREAGVPLYTLDPEGSATNPAYADMLRGNRDTLLKAFK